MGERVEISAKGFSNILNLQDNRFFPNLSGIITVNNVTFFENIENNNTYTDISNYSFHFVECTFNDEVKINFIKSKNLIFSNCSFSKSIIFEDFTLSFDLIFELSDFKSETSISNIESKKFKINDCNFSDTSNEIKNYKIKEGLIISNSYFEQLDLGQCENESITSISGIYTDKYINFLNLNNSKNIKIYSKNSENYFRNIEVTGRQDFNANLEINIPSLNQLVFRSFENLGKTILSGINKITLINIGNATLNNLEFRNCNLENTSFVITHSKVENLFFSGSKPPLPEKINEDIKIEKILKIEGLQIFKKIFEKKGDIINSSKYFESELQLSLEITDLIDHQKRKSIYSHLKKLYDQTGDSVKALEYQAKELEEYRKSINWGNRFWEKLNLSVNKITNNYGTNWALALLVTLVVNGFFFTIFSFSLGYLPGKNLNLFWELFSYSPEFLNPLRKAEFIEKIDGKCVEYGNWSRIIDYSARIFVTICVYQLIQAFRKYGKK